MMQVRHVRESISRSGEPGGFISQYDMAENRKSQPHFFLISSYASPQAIIDHALTLLKRKMSIVPCTTS